jgi:STE24 endopeptidase
MAGGSDILTALLVVVAIGVAVEALVLPLAYFEGVTLERRYGLSTQSNWHWWGDWAKSSALWLSAVAIAGLSVWFLLQWTSSWWWMFAAAGATAVVVLLTQLAPVLLLPLFDACEPLGREALVARLMALAARANTRVLGVFEWHLGARTKKANAALTGLGRTRRILVSDTLLAEHSDDEVEVILAHELAHHVYHDIWTSIGVQAALITAAAYAADLVLDRWAESFGLRGSTDVAVMPMLALAGGTVLCILMPLANAVSRAHERRADRYALEMTRNAPAFISAMRKLGAQNLSDDRPSALVEAVFYTHPPVSARISSARAWAAAER